MCASLNRKNAKAVDRPIYGEYNKGKILDQRVIIFTQIFSLDEGFHLGIKGGWDE
jgi:hypothetical protein